LLGVLAGSALLGCGTSSPPAQGDASPLIRLARAAPDEVPDAHQRRLLKLAAELPCPCVGRAGSLARCAAGDAPCPRAPFALRLILRGLARGAPDGQIRLWAKRRYPPGAPVPMDLRHAPCKGPTQARALVVVYSDFQCPACGFGRRLLEAVSEETGDRMRLCFKNLPLRRIHPHAQLAAQAAMAAHLQQKFWPMHDLLFDNQHALDRDALVSYAEKAGLDRQRFVADFDGQRVRALVARDLAEARTLGLRGTPTFFVNGREVTDPITLVDFVDWVEEAAAVRSASR
jgi:hypothetical protein